MHNRFVPWGLFCAALLPFLMTGCTDPSKPAEPSPPHASAPAAPVATKTTPVQPPPVQPPPAPPQPAAIKTPPVHAVPLVTYELFKKPVTPAVFELPSGALIVWREFAKRKPALLLFSTHPLLAPLSEGDRKGLKKLLTSGSARDIVRRGQIQSADPAFASAQTVSAAIDAGLIGELIFVQPTRRKRADVSLQDFQQRAYNAGFLSAAETSALTLQDGVISGKVRGLPFRVVHLDALPRIDRPVIVHVDLGYFKDLYVNEIKTPVYDLLSQTATAIRDAGYPALAVTLSYSNKEVEFSLESRFMISNLADLLYHPAMLGGITPPSWVLRARAMFAGAMFAESSAQDLIAQAAQLNPDDPDALYAQAQQLFLQKQSVAAFSLLDQAVALDRGYALAYLELAETGVELGQWEKAVEILDKAANAFPDDPFIRISQADLLIQHGRGQEALPLLTALQQLPWSEIHHPGVSALLKEMAVAAAK
jgi:hypothetical protein